MWHSPEGGGVGRCVLEPGGEACCWWVGCGLWLPPTRALCVRVCVLVCLRPYTAQELDRPWLYLADALGMNGPEHSLAQLTFIILLYQFDQLCAGAAGWVSFWRAVHCAEMTHTLGRRSSSRWATVAAGFRLLSQQ